MDRVDLKVAVANDHGGLTAIASAPTLDRDLEILDAGCFEPLPAAVPIHVDHVWTTGAVVGKGRPYYRNGVLMVDVTFGSDRQSQEIRGKVTEGLISTMSVGFRDAKRKRDAKGVEHVTQGELLEVSLVTVPSNRQAQIIESRGYVGSVAAMRAEIKHLAADALLAAARAEIKEARAVLAQAEGRRESSRSKVRRALRELGLK